MLEQVRERLRAVTTRLRRLERREVQDFRRWLENTRNLVHISVLLLLPLLMGVVTALSNAVTELPFLLFPPLASGTYTLFSQPESRYASPRRFVGGLTGGAACGWVSLELVSRLWYQTTPEAVSVSPGAVALGVLLTGGVTWLLDVEEPSAFSAALLVYVVDFTQTTQSTYVLSVLLSSSLVAAVFVLWRREFYEQRAEYLYQSTKGDDHVLIPMRTETAGRTAMLGARLAASHDAGKVVLLDIVDEKSVAEAERQFLDDDGDGEATREAAETVATAAKRLEQRADRIETEVGVPCEVVVAVGGGTPATTVLDAAAETNCDLVATPYEQRHGSLSPFIRSLFRGNTDVLVHRSQDERTEWRHVLVPVRRAGDVAHAMVDFALRLARGTGQVGVASCIGEEESRRRAESMLADLVEPFAGAIETRVARSSIEQFLADHARQYDLVIIGASMDRSAASRFISPPTFERLADLDCDVAIVDRNFS
ncbi:universal stress protein [Halorientalis litorea]|uniref:universal stress protein n=1 Tax=Halorientalis litorea TaxID=2931977 RepID=UPI001FF620DF|nr:HPP family protein [Halorientalis litorea]